MIQSFMPNSRGRRPVDLPQLVDANGRLLPRYLIEKITGVRRETGALKLKRLTNRHMKIIGMHLEGMSLEQIAMNARVSIPTVSRVLNDPLATAILQKIYKGREEEIKALTGKAIDVVRKGMDGEQPMGVRLRAVDRLAKLRETVLPKDKGAESAEDVIARMLERTTIIGENVQINVGVEK